METISNFLQHDYSNAIVTVTFFILFITALYVRKRIIGCFVVDDYVYEEETNIYLFQQVGIDILFSINSSGVQFLTTYRMRKFNIINQKYLFDVAIPETEVLGMSDTHFFGKVSQRKLMTLDLNSGKINYFNKKTIQKKNPQLKDFSFRNSDLHYCSYYKTFIFRDVMGYYHKLDITNMQVTGINSEKTKAAQWENFKHIFSTYYYPRVSITKHGILNGSNHFRERGNTYDIESVSINKSKEHFILIKKGYIKDEDRKNTEKTFKDRFISPNFMNNGSDIYAYYTPEPPTILVAHTTSLKPTLDTIFISRVGTNSKEIWRIPIREIGSWGNLYYIEKNEKVYFVTYTSIARGFNMDPDMPSHNFRVSVIEKETGKVLQKQKLFKNRIGKVI